MLEFRVLGAVRAVVDGEVVHVGGPRQRRLLAALVIDRNRVVSTDRLVDAVFAGEPTARAATTLRTYVMRLRRIVEPDGGEAVLETQAPGYRLNIDDDAVDAGRFEHLVGVGRAQRDDGDPVAAASALREALALWEGEAYAEFDTEPWAQPEATRLAVLRQVAEEQLIEAELDCGLAAELVPRLESMVEHDPFRESIRASLMVALYRSGRQADALAAARDYRAALGEDTGLDPSPELDELERKILAHDDELRRVEPPARTVRGYVLGERLGSGRDGTVHAARLPGVERDLVVRVVPAELADEPAFVRSFDARMRRIASLHREAIVPIDDHWREAGAAYVVLRRMRGGSLRDRLEHGPLSPVDVAMLARRVGSALVAAAERGVAHGRVIPASVLLDDTGAAHLSDFALAEDGTSPTEDVAAFAELLWSAATAGVPARTRDDPLVELLAQAVAAPTSTPIEELVAAVERAAGVTAGSTVASNPYKGLQAFDEPDAADFFGRDGLVDELVRRLGRAGVAGRAMLVVGASGSGKSSTVRAGLLPRLRAGAVPGSDRWLVTTMVPGATPFYELAESLTRIAREAGGGTAASVGVLAHAFGRGETGLHDSLRGLLPDGGEVLLVVDQLEELFTLADSATQEALLTSLLHALAAPDSRLRMVATLRADFYDRPLRYQPFARVVDRATVTIPAMAAAELEETITGPADRAGLAVEPALVAELVAAVANQPAAMPAMQFTLYELAAASDGELTVEAYRRLGGVGGAIAGRAEELYASLEDDGIVRRLFEQLVVVEAGGEPTRRPAPRSELVAVAAGRDLDAIIGPWTDARLLSHDRHPETREPTIEVAHEALLREWPRLRAWIEADRSTLVAVAELRDAARGWEALDRDPDALHRGARLETTLVQLGERTETLPPLEQTFLAASVEARDERRRRDAERVARQARTNRRLRRQLVALSLATVVALIGGVIALDQRGQAQDDRRIATARELAAASLSVVAEDAELGLLLALEAVEEVRDRDGTVLPEAESALHRAVTASRLVSRVPGIGGSLDWHPDGTMFATEGTEESGLVDVRDAASGEPVHRFVGHDGDVNDVAFSPDGAHVATTGDDGRMRVWEVATGEMRAEVVGRGSVWRPSFSPDGRVVVAAWADEGLVRVLDLSSDAPAVAIVSFAPRFTSFGPEGRRIAIGGRDGVEVVALDDGAVTLELKGRGPAGDVAWSPDGRWLAIASLDGDHRIVEVESGLDHATLPGHPPTVNDLDWSADSRLLVSGAADGIARVFELTEDGVTERLSIATRTGQVWGVALSPDGARLLTGDQIATVASIWDVGVSGGSELANVPIPSSVQEPDVAFTPEGDGVITPGSAGAAVVWDASTGAGGLELGVDGGIGPAASIEVSPDGDLVATTGHGDDVRVWDRRTGEEVFTARVPSLTPTDVAWSPDGELLAIAGEDRRVLGRIGIVDRTGRLVTELEDGPDRVALAVAFTADGERLVATRRGASRDQAIAGVRIWDWRRGGRVADLPTLAWAIAASPVGSLFATADAAGGATLWDARTGQRTATLTGHNGDVIDVSFSADGSRVATSGVDRTVRLWDAETGAQQLVLRGHEDPVTAVSFGPDGDRLVSASPGLARVWALDVDDLVAIAETRVTRSLTDDECRQYLHVERCGE